MAESGRRALVEPDVALSFRREEHQQPLGLVGDGLALAAGPWPGRHHDERRPIPVALDPPARVDEAVDQDRAAWSKARQDRISGT